MKIYVGGAPIVAATPFFSHALQCIDRFLGTIVVTCLFNLRNMKVSVSSGDNEVA